MKTTLVMMFCALAGLLAACGKPPAPGAAVHSRIVVAVSSPIPHGDILQQVVTPLLAKQGIALEVRIINGGEINGFLVQRQVDANYFQHAPYLDAYNADHQTGLVSVAGVHIEPFGAYSRRYRHLDDIPDGAEVVIPNDPSNHGRALLLLDHAGLITLRERTHPLTRVQDISQNPKHLRFREVDPALLVRILDQVDLALISSNYVLSAGMNPARDALIMEAADSPYVNLLVTRPEDRDDARVQALARALTSPEVKSFIETHYPGAVLPAF